jgi:hypothetical protein
LSWHQKVYDFQDAFRSLFGRVFSMEEVGEYNEVVEKLGSVENVSYLFKQGKLEVTRIFQEFS